MSIFKKENYVRTFGYVNAEDDHPLNKPYEFDWPDGMNFCLTMKYSLNFECEEATNEVEGDKKFLPFAMRKSGLTVVKYYKTEDAADKDGVWYHAPYGYYLFLWNRAGECVNGAY
jgi:hypothetical protein